VNAPTPPVDPGGAERHRRTIDQHQRPDGTPSSAIVTPVGITLLSVALALLLMMTSFTKIFVVLAMACNALVGPLPIPGLNEVPRGTPRSPALFIMAS
jgi:flagellar biosynthetic protein FliP